MTDNLPPITRNNKQGIWNKTNSKTLRSLGTTLMVFKCFGQFLLISSKVQKENFGVVIFCKLLFLLSFSYSKM